MSKMKNVNAANLEIFAACLKTHIPTKRIDICGTVNPGGVSSLKPDTEGIPFTVTSDGMSGALILGGRDIYCRDNSGNELSFALNDNSSGNGMVNLGGKLYVNCNNSGNYVQGVGIGCVPDGSNALKVSGSAYFTGAIFTDVTNPSGNQVVNKTHLNSIINSLDCTIPSESGKCVYSITQTDGLVSYTKTDTISKADKFSSNRTISLTGTVTGSATGDGSSGWSIATSCIKLNMGNGDATQRVKNTTPSEYNGHLVFTGLKINSNIELQTSATYSYVVGLRGWSDESGGAAHEIAFNDNGVFFRTSNAADDGWNDWQQNMNSVNYTTWCDPRYVNVTGDTMSGPLIVNITDTTLNGIQTNAQIQANTFYANSDRRLKENIENVTQCFNSILDLPIYYYNYLNSNIRQIGCMAQDLQEICPEIVNEGKDGYLSIQESKIIYLLLLQMRELKNKIKKLEHYMEIYD